MLPCSPDEAAPSWHCSIFLTLHSVWGLTSTALLTVGSFHGVKGEHLTKFQVALYKDHNWLPSYTSANLSHGSSMTFRKLSSCSTFRGLTPNSALRYIFEEVELVVSAMVLPAQNGKHKCSTDYIANHAPRLEVQWNSDLRSSIR